MRAGLVGAICVLCASSSAWAQMRHLQDEYRSPQNFAFELRLGPYYPDVDSEEGLTGRPFETVFETHGRLRMGFELDFQALRTPVGSLGVGIGASVVRFVGQSRFTDTGASSSEETTLTVIPLTASLVARVDFAMQRFQVPLVPYGKIGISDYIWFAEDGGGIAHAPLGSDEDGLTGSDTTLGWEAAAGMALLLDFFEPDSARKLDADAGVNHSYLFFEVLFATVEGLGGHDSMILSDRTWNAGLLLEF